MLSEEERLEKRRELKRGYSLTERGRKRRREWDRRHRRKNPLAKYARTFVWRLLKRGKLVYTECALCGDKEDLCFHHPDYTKPKEVVCMCKTCHRQLHAIRWRKR